MQKAGALLGRVAWWWAKSEAYRTTNVNLNLCYPHLDRKTRLAMGKRSLQETGKTAFGLVKELRNGWRAFWYNTTAKMFKISIKEEFRPESTHEDYLIEDILQRAFAENRLERQKSVLDYDYASLTNKWNSTHKQKK